MFRATWGNSVLCSMMKGPLHFNLAAYKWPAYEWAAYKWAAYKWAAIR